MGHDKGYEKVKELFLKRKFYLGLFFLLPVFFSLFTVGSSLILLERLNTLGEHIPQYKEEIISIYNFAVRWTYILTIGAFIVGLIVAYSLVRPAKKLLKEGMDDLREFGSLGKEFTELASSLRQYLSVLEGMSGGVITVNRNGDITMANTQACQILGLPQEGIIGSNLTGLFPYLSKSLKNVLSGGVVSSEMLYRIKGGEKVIGYTFSPIKSSSGIDGAVFIFKDITEIKKIHDDLKRTEMLASIGSIAREVAHEVKNPLASMKGLIQLIGEDIPEKDHRRMYIDTILNEIDRLNRVVDKLIERKTKEEKADLKEALHRIVLLCSQTVKDRTVRTIEEYDETVDIKGTSDGIFQAFYNIILNAYEAAEDGGEVIVRTKAIENNAVIEVISSSRIDSSIRDRIFEEGFTTKAEGHGIGLKIAKDEIERAGGSISIEPSDDRTKFLIRMLLK